MRRTVLGAYALEGLPPDPERVAPVHRVHRPVVRPLPHVLELRIPQARRGPDHRLAIVNADPDVLRRVALLAVQGEGGGTLPLALEVGRPPDSQLAREQHHEVAAVVALRHDLLASRGALGLQVRPELLQEALRALGLGG